MTRFRSHLSFAILLLASWSAVAADDDHKKDAKEAKKEVKFGINVAQRGLWQEARFRFEQATALDPESAAAFNNLGVTLEQQGEFDKARAAYERALQLEPKNTSIQQNYDLFREADEKRNRKLKKDTPAKPRETPTPDPAGPRGEGSENRR
jgi:Tfp pilus assembly protein PilF